MGKNKKIQKIDSKQQYLLGIKKDEAEIKMYEKLLKIKKRKPNKINHFKDIFKDFDPVSDEDCNEEHECNNDDRLKENEMEEDISNSDEGEMEEDISNIDEGEMEENVSNSDEDDSDIIEEELSDEEQSIREDEISNEVKNGENADLAEKAKIKRSILSHLNKLCESQMMKCLDAMEEIYEENPRGVVRDIFIKESLNYLKFSCLDMAAFVSCLHMRWLKKTNLIAFYMEHLVSKLTELGSMNWEKETSTLTMATQGYKFIAYVTRLEIIDTNLIIDMIHEIITTFEISRLKVVAEICSILGFYVRKHNLARCEEFVSVFKTKMNDHIRCTGDISEIRSLSDAIVDKLTTAKAKNDIVFRNMVQYRKLMRTWCKNSVSSESVALRLADFRGENRVRWWLVGSALNPHLAHNKSAKSVSGSTTEDKNEKLTEKEKQWNEIAVSLGFATAGKQSLFRALMCVKEQSGEDEDDFTEILTTINNLSQSKKRENRKLIVPEAEITGVIIRCLVLEKEFCPFYSNLLCALISSQRQYRQLVKCTIWDVLRQHNLVDTVRINCGRCVGQLISAVNFPVNSLRNYNFLDNSAGNIGFMKAVLSEILEENWKDISTLLSEMSVKISLKFISNIRLFLKNNFLPVGKCEQLSREVLHKVNKCIDFIIELRKSSL